MGWLSKTFTSSVGKKLIMAVTGLFLISFLIVHLSGNFLLLKNDNGAAFLQYSEFMKTNPVILVMEVVLFLGFIFHAFSGFRLALENKKARPVGYAVNRASENSSFFSRSMVWTGSIVFIFLVIHLKSFFIDHKVAGWLGATHEETLFQAAVSAFQNPLYTGFYVVAMVILGFHLNHGFQSAFQTLGLNHKKYTPLIEKLGLIYSIVVPVLFAYVPIYFLLIYKTTGGN